MEIGNCHSSPKLWGKKGEKKVLSFDRWFVHHKIFTLEMFRICCKIIISFNFNFRNLVWLVIWFCMSNIRKSGGINYWFLRRSLGLKSRTLVKMFIYDLPQHDSKSILPQRLEKLFVYSGVFFVHEMTHDTF